MTVALFGAIAEFQCLSPSAIFDHHRQMDLLPQFFIWCCRQVVVNEFSYSRRRLHKWWDDNTTETRFPFCCSFFERVSYFSHFILFFKKITSSKLLPTLHFIFIYSENCGVWVCVCVLFSFQMAITEHNNRAGPERPSASNFSLWFSPVCFFSLSMPGIEYQVTSGQCHFKNKKIGPFWCVLRLFLIFHVCPVVDFIRVKRGSLLT